MALLTLGADMARPSRTGGKPTKQRRKRIVPKRRNAPKAMRNRGVSNAGQETVVARLTQERDEALLRETANVEILRLLQSRPAIWNCYFEPSWRTPLASVTRILERCFASMVKTFSPWRNLIRPRRCSRHKRGEGHSSQHLAPQWSTCCGQSR